MSISRSPTRRHILSSINHEARHQRSASPVSNFPEPGPSPNAVTNLEFQNGPERSDERRSRSSEPRRSRLKLKGHRSSRHRSHHRDADELEPEPSERSHDGHFRRRRRKKRRRSSTPPNLFEPPPLDPEAAFRESLFDAMADDEGAAYWEGVYGQPVHVYANEKVGLTGELEQMTDEEYTAYVRKKMWEKTHAGLLEERARREEVRMKAEQECQRTQKLRQDMESSLRRGEERRERKKWESLWNDYANAWLNWDGREVSMSWPTESGRRCDVSTETVKRFFERGLDRASVGDAHYTAKLKEERVRWHPDKMQQRLGGKGDADLVKDVTAIFQIIDSLWGEVRSSKS